ncbi:hypothetical protein BB560_006295, partial [Smittium megazygosporum]
MVSVLNGVLYFAGFEVSGWFLGRFNAKLNFGFRTVNYMICLLIAASISICVSPVLFVLDRRADVNFVTARLFYLFSRVLLGYTVEIENSEYLNKQPCVFIGNHQSALDLVWLGATFPKRAVIIAKYSIKFVP